MLIQGYLAYKKPHTPQRTAIGPWAYAYCKVLGGGVVLWARYPCVYQHPADTPTLPGKGLPGGLFLEKASSREDMHYTVAMEGRRL